jgi:hypothetical protein
MQSLKASPPAPSAGAPQRLMPESNLPRFNYNDYMKTLNSKLELSAPNSLTGSSFEKFLLKEKQDYLKSVGSTQSHHYNK